MNHTTIPARDVLTTIYLDWVNNYVTLERFAECNGLTLLQAMALTSLARDIYHTEHPEK